MMKIFRKTLILSLVMTFFFAIHVYADNDKQYVYDDGELMLEDDREDLQQKCKDASEKLKIDIAVVTTYDADGKTSRSYAEDWIVDHDLGYEEDRSIDRSCVLFLIDLDNNSTYIATSGLGILYVEDNDIEDILDQIYLYIKTDYYSACSTFVDKTVDVVTDNRIDYGGEYDEEWETFDGTYKEFYNEYVSTNKNTSIFHRLRNPFICIIIALIIGTVSVAVMAFSNKAKMTASGNTYMDKREFRLHVNSDKYIRTTTTKIRINDDSSSGGGGHGGSFHSGSGGGSFGGGGRSL